MATSSLGGLRDNLREFDTHFLRGNPWRHRKGFWEHVYPASLAVVLVKNGIIQGAKLMSAEVAPVVPWDDSAQLAHFALEHLRWPVAKDILIATAARVYERLLVEHVYAGDPLAGARFVRGEADGRGKRAVQPQ